jgi:hypothetical protein
LSRVRHGFTSGPSGRICPPSAALCFCGRRRGCRHAGCPKQGLPPYRRRSFGCLPLVHVVSVSAAAGWTAREVVGRVGAATASGCSSPPPSPWPAQGRGQPTPVEFAWQPGLPFLPPWARSAMSFLPATLLAFEVRWMPSPAQMLAPSTVVRS